MIKLAKELKRSERNKMLHDVRGVYFDNDDHLFAVYLKKYHSCVVTLRTALSIYNIIDDWNNPPYDLVFQEGYRKIKDTRIRQFRDKKELLCLGVVTKEYEGISYDTYNYERLLIEVFRKQKYLSFEDYKQVVFFYRKKVNDGEFNIPLFYRYLSVVPKSRIYKAKFSKEIM